MLTEKNRRLFEEEAIFSSFLRLAVPTMLGQIILVIYNMADTFFIGLTGSDAMITAVTVCMPAFMFLSAIANLFGVGGSSVLARNLGMGEIRKASLSSAFAFWGCLVVALLYSAGTLALIHPFTNALGGGHPNVHHAAVQYLQITVVLGGVFPAMNNLLAHLVRSVGSSVHASVGITFGGILNIILDPLFMFVILPDGMEVVGAAIATALSNVLAVVYFIIVLRVKRKAMSVLSFGYTKAMYEDGLPRQILANGLPACLMTLFENISYAILDRLMFTAGTACQAGIGVAKKINMLAHCMVRGIAQGVLPLISYNYGAKNYKRLRGAINCSIGASFVLSAACMVTYLLTSRFLVGLFFAGETISLTFGSRFLQILCIGCPFSGVAYAIISFYQAIGQNKRSFVLAILRKGVLDIPLMFILNEMLRVYGIVWATPVADIICCVVAVTLFRMTMKELKQV